MNGDLLAKQYKNHLSGFREWEDRHTAAECTLYKKNLGKYISMDETSLSQGELYTIVTNKAAKGGKGALIAMMKGTKSEDIIFHLKKLPRHKRLQVKEITIDLSPTMKLIAKKAFPNADIVSDRFHVQKLMNEAISDMRVNYRWQAIDLENSEIELAKELGRKYIPTTFDNGDTRKQLLARSRHIVMKNQSRWTDSQRRRADILFYEYPEIAEAYEVSMELTQIYNKTKDRGVAMTRLMRWYDKVEKLNLTYFKSVINTMQNNYATIVNYFENRSTNASAESFNAKIKAFRAQFRGVRDIPFFIFRLSKLFA